MSPASAQLRLAAVSAAALLLAIQRPAAAGVEFAPPVTYTLTQAATSVVLGDLDGDGDLDAVVGTNNGRGVQVFMNRGDGTFDPAPAVDAPPQGGVAIADLDGDGHADLATMDGSVSVYRGHGDGTFEYAYSVPVGSYAGPLVAADLDGDHLADVAVLSIDSWAPRHLPAVSVAVLLNRNGSLAPPALYPATSGARSITAGDLDGDGRPDLVTGNVVGSVSVLLNRGDGTFWGAADYEANGLISCVAIGDLDGDGDPDLAAADEAGSMNALLNDGHGAFTFGGNTLMYGRAECVTLADFDSDGHADVAVSRDDLGQVIALAGRGDGTFLFPALYFATGAGAHGIASGDLNGDGRPDVVTADMGTGDGGSMSVLISGAPRACGRNDMASGIGASGLVAADFNADGALDLATTNEDNTLAVLLNDGLGSFKPAQHYPLGTLSQNLAVGDFDSDSRPDLVASNYGESTVTLYHNRGDGSFDVGESLPMGPHPRWVEVADVDGNGRPDLVTADYNDAIRNGSVTVRLNRDGQTFGPPVTYGVGVGPYEVRAANLNHDDMPDLVVCNYDGQSVSILINRGDGTFAPEVRYPTAWSLSAAIADFDHDGDNDIAVANFKENTVTVLKNDGNGALTRYADFTVGRQPRSIRAAILKGDGDIDLAVALATTSEVILLANDGTGLFPGTSTPCGVGVNPKTLIVSDFDGNGGHDLATANNGAGTVSILLDVSPPNSARSKASVLKRSRKLGTVEPKYSFSLAMSRPNPAFGEAIIPFEIPREAPVELRIFDVAGRVVRTLVDGSLPAGPHELRWDGTTDRGDRARPGTYFYRLRAADQQAVRTLMLH